MAVTYTPERAQLVAGNSDGFWLQGGSMDAVVNWRKGLGLAADVSGSHASNVASGVDVNKLLFLAGGRYTRKLPIPRAHNVQVFVEGLFGDAHGFNSVFPTSAGTKPSADAFAMQTGGGLNMALYKRFGVRLVQVDYVKTTLPNHASNTQDDLRLAAGVTYHIGKH
jgi:hypothetical protein